MNTRTYNLAEAASVAGPARALSFRWPAWRPARIASLVADRIQLCPSQ
jgi:hypothetical protein